MICSVIPICLVKREFFFFFSVCLQPVGVRRSMELVTWLLFGNWSEGSRGPRSDGNINHYESKLKCFVSWILPLGLGLDKYDTQNPLMRGININLDFLRRLLIIIFTGGEIVSQETAPMLDQVPGGLGFIEVTMSTHVNKIHTKLINMLIPQHCWICESDWSETRFTITFACLRLSDTFIQSDLQMTYESKAIYIEPWKICAIVLEEQSAQSRGVSASVSADFFLF